MGYVIALLLGLLAAAVIRAWLYRREAHRWQSAATVQAVRAEAAEAMNRRILLALTPLIEKTDWMTGRWYGKFDRLVQMEQKRNDSVEAVRVELMSLPEVQTMDPVALLHTAGTQAGEAFHREIFGD